MQKKIIDEQLALTRLDVFLHLETNIQRSKVQELNPRVNGQIKRLSYKLKTGDVVEFEQTCACGVEDEILPQNIPLEIKYEDDFLLVINKQKDLLVHPTAHQKSNTLVNALLAHCGDNLSNKSEPNRRGIVHRLDKNTAGLMLAAKTDEAALLLQKQIRNKTAKRKYLAIALGNFSDSCGIIDKPLKHFMHQTVKMEIAKSNEGKEALTLYKVIEQFDGAALVELELKTGRTHQIRAHLASINHPVFGDSLYGSKAKTPEYLRNVKTCQQVLQSYKLSFTHPNNGAIMSFELSANEWDEDLNKVLKILRSKK